VLGRQILGGIRTLREDREGAYYEVELFDGIPALILNGLKRAAYGASFQFTVLSQDFNPRARKSAHNPRGIPERTINEAKVYEFGPVSFPAYEGTTAKIGSTANGPRSRRTPGSWRL
jgi:phage head maturation protease